MINRILKLLFLFLIVGCIKIRAATVDTALTYSASMHENIRAVGIKPDDSAAVKKFPVIYLLQGFSGNYGDWIKKVPAIIKLADQYQVIIICPDGNAASWYFDSPLNDEWKYETYIATELVNWIEGHYATIPNRSGRAITGLSMGGHGALYLAFKHLDIFGAAGSMSGGADIRAFPDSFGIEQVLGKYSEHPDRWEQNSVVNMVYLLKPNLLAIIFDCGYDDFFYQANQAFHDKLLERKIPHDYTVRSGGHSWEYWSIAVNYQLLFFSRFSKAM